MIPENVNGGSLLKATFHFSCIVKPLSNIQNNTRINKVIFQQLSMLCKDTNHSMLKLPFHTKQTNLLTVTPLL